MAKDDLFVINDGLEMRTSSSGKPRFVIRRVTEPIVINTDPAFAGMKPAKAFAEFLKQKIKGITELAPEATQKARLVALKAFTLGKPWAMARYSGGRTGSKPPARTMFAFNDSERMAEGITVTKGTAEGASYRVNVPGNRLDESTSGGFERIWNKLVRLVPELGNPLSVGVVQEGVKWTLQNMIQKRQATTGKLRFEIVEQVFELAMRAAEALDDVAA